MNILLFILKMLGVVITGRATVVGLFKHELFETIEIKSLIITVPPMPSKTEQRLTKKGKRAILWAVIGILTSLFAQGVEQTLNIKRDKDSRVKAESQMLLLSNSVQRAQQQLELATESLEEIKYGRAEILGTMAMVQRMLNPIETLSLKIKCEIPSVGIPPDPPLLTNLASIMHEVVASQHKPFAKYSEFRGDYPNSENIVMLSKDGESTFSFGIPETPEGKSLALDTSVALLRRLVTDGQEETGKRQHLIDFIEAPKATIHIGKKSSGGVDFSASSVSSKIADIQYLLPSGRLVVSWSFEFSKEAWQHNSEVKCLPDLESSLLTFTFDNWPKDQETCYDRISATVEKYRHAVYPFRIDLSVNDKWIHVSAIGFPSNGSEGVEAEIGEVPIYRNLGKYIDEVGIKPPPVTGGGSSAGGAISK